MIEFIFVVVVVAGLWILFSYPSKQKEGQAFNSINDAEYWFVKEGIEPSTVRFSSYNDIGLSRNSGALVIVGSGDKSNGSHVGFVLEVMPGAGVIEGEYLEPCGIATHHRSASQTAKMKGMPLMDILQDMARQHRKKNSG